MTVRDRGERETGAGSSIDYIYHHQKPDHAGSFTNSWCTTTYPLVWSKRRKEEEELAIRERERVERWRERGIDELKNRGIAIAIYIWDGEANVSLTRSVFWCFFYRISTLFFFLRLFRTMFVARISLSELEVTLLLDWSGLEPCGWRIALVRTRKQDEEWHANASDELVVQSAAPA